MIINKHCNIFFYILACAGTIDNSLNLLIFPLYQKNTFTEKLDLTDNYIEASGGVALARMLMDNCFITEIVS